jgi:hypothetical protein
MNAHSIAPARYARIVLALARVDEPKKPLRALDKAFRVLTSNGNLSPSSVALVCAIADAARLADQR